MTEKEILKELRAKEGVIDSLQSELAETNKGLMALTMELEERVDERTAELARGKQLAELLHKVTEIASESKTFELSLKECLYAICDSTQWPVGHVYLPSPEGEEKLSPTKIWFLSRSHFESPFHP